MSAKISTQFEKSTAHNPVVTPTTKDDNDRPITPEEIVSGGFMRQDQMEYVFNKALELFKKDADLILCNRSHSELSDVQDKIFTRDLFNQD